MKFRSGDRGPRVARAASSHPARVARVGAALRVACARPFVRGVPAAVCSSLLWYVVLLLLPFCGRCPFLSLSPLLPLRGLQPQLAPDAVVGRDRRFHRCFRCC